MMNTNSTQQVRTWFQCIATFILVLLIGLLPQLSTEAAQQGLLAEGERAPEFSLPNALGGMVSLTDYLGKRPVLLFFHMAVG